MKKVIVVGIVALLASCTPPAAEQDVSAVLEPQIGEIRLAAGNGDRARAAQELAEFRSTVERLRRTDDLSEERAREILEAADEVARHLSLITPPRPTPVRRSPTPSPTPRRTPSPTPSPTPEEPEPTPTDEPEPTQPPQTPPDNDDDRGNNDAGRPGQDGLPGILQGPG